ncbi:PREDICTED: uncharacterized protein LOC107337772 [Acropora digitifera]|uniref:uncharacterized protein LOC107337772 n=1 Tax=Acropora digitifera TaxID=70779 RepID=UPI00077A351A|nr:PREDICTED: uncharacterized protein LOC107337772 [Acropora digitifera]
MWWTGIKLAIPLVVLNSLVQCADLPPSRKKEPHPTATKGPIRSKVEATLEIKQANIRQNQTERPTVKPPATTRKVTTKKTTSPSPMKEFSLDDILFRGRLSNEANAFIKANEQRGKTLETTYEHVREQDLNDIEAWVNRRNEIQKRTLPRV